VWLLGANLLLGCNNQTCIITVTRPVSSIHCCCVAVGCKFTPRLQQSNLHHHSNPARLIDPLLLCGCWMQILLLGCNNQACDITVTPFHRSIAAVWLLDAKLTPRLQLLTLRHHHINLVSFAGFPLLPLPLHCSSNQFLLVY
jgi:hypothetical protein